jgi:hypothetical protein
LQVLDHGYAWVEASNVKHGAKWHLSEAAQYRGSVQKLLDQFKILDDDLILLL